MGNKLSYQSRKKRISNSTTAKKSSIQGNSSSLIDEKHHDTDSNTHTSSVCTSGRKSSQVSTTTYWFPNHNDELDRLSSQHFALKILFEGNISSHILNRLNMENSVVLDLGCGPGTWLMDVATEFPGSQFYGIDIFDLFPSNIRPANVTFQVRDALEGLPFPDNTFDLVNLRMFIISIKANEWPVVLKEIYRVLKPGGFIQCCECSMLERGNEFVLKAGRAFTESVIDREQDPYVAHKMDKTLQAADFNILNFETKDIYFGKTDALNKEFLWDIVMIFKSAQPVIEERVGYTGEDYEQFLELFNANLQKKPDAIWTFYRCVGQK
ncbi:S-adenosyl-L-methionine-dependent methyltransferase [Rhizopus microsporus var. microsporus]|uniref:S-adenosyl-L-methionine-dependent methyltransferase n=2 Tax=Rhizopus microsporus TaxID=58291 RepID=A0A2G4SNJ4_RHIZD|nr:S-adenosyl-L-methionine-dependent methyltransferase [Rhizopus microsporus ATCC 52813]ORE07215.1 S-adenosyl-L-methionine-dependent methyltransferase [Rhizopus microsporus var. microsporus]PHZ09956.1 S-adenosyl-L-methionine-dependent methyltransferase [Rhizopus microsporus ATCC 52813]